MTRRRAVTLSSALAAALLSTSCAGGSPGPSASGGPGPTPSTTAATGTFTISVVPPSDLGAGHTVLAGRVYDGALPETTQWTQLSALGGCKLLKPKVPFCSASCGADACVADGTCQRYPTARSVGGLTISGLGSSAFDVAPISAAYSLPGTVSLPYPPFAEGAAVTLAAAGDHLPAFTLASRGIAPLALSAGSYAIVKTSAAAATYEPLVIGWTAAAQPSLATVHVTVDVSHHGGIKGKVVCEAEDVGSLTIPGDLVTRLVGLGVAAYPKVEATRRATGSAAVGGGTVTLNVESTVAAPLRIEGYTCTTGGECPSGSCDTNLGFCN